MAVEVKSFRDCHDYAEQVLDKYHMSKGDPATFKKLREMMNTIIELCADTKYAEATAAIQEAEKFVSAELQPVPG